MLEADIDDLQLVEGFLEVKGVPEKKRSIPQLFQAKYGAAVGNMVGSYDKQTTGGLDPSTGKGKGSAFFFMSACAAEVEVDTETGKVAVQQVVSVVDAGKAINPQQCHLQNEGSMIMSLGSTTMVLITSHNSTFSIIYHHQSRFSSRSYSTLLLLYTLQYVLLQLRHRHPSRPPRFLQQRPKCEHSGDGQAHRCFVIEGLLSENDVNRRFRIGRAATVALQVHVQGLRLGGRVEPTSSRPMPLSR